MKIISREYGIGKVEGADSKIVVRASITTLAESWYKDRIMNITYDEFAACMKKWNDGAMIQDAFPMLTPDEREHLLTAGKFDDIFNAVGDA